MIELAGAYVIALVAHPDDESWPMGGSLALAARAGAQVQVVCATRGEAGFDRSGLVPSGEALAAVRSQELARSCEVLGLLQPRFLDLGDSRLGDAEGVPDGRLTAAVGALLDELRPDVVFTLGEDGGYAHRDHVALWRALRSAVGSQEAGAPAVWEVAFPPRLLHPFWKALRRAGSELVLRGLPAESFGVDDDDVDRTVPLDPDLAARKLAAIAAHRSQLVGGDPHTLLPRGVIESLLQVERFRVAAPPSRRP